MHAPQALENDPWGTTKKTANYEADKKMVTWELRFVAKGWGESLNCAKDICRFADSRIL